MNTDLYALLACPKCHGKLAIITTRPGLLCPACALVFPILKGIPHMLIDSAVPQKEWEPSPFVEEK